MKLQPRSLQEETFPPEHRGWVKTSLIQPMNQFMREASSLLSGNLLLGDNAACQKLTFDVAVPDTWVLVGASGAPAFANSWVATGGGSAPPSFWKDAFGKVHLRGLVRNGTVGLRAFTMPKAYAPPYLHSLPAVSNNAFAQVDIGTDGGVAPAVGSNLSFDLTGVSFFASDRSPVAPSCFPVSLRYLGSKAPSGVVVWNIVDKAQPRTRLPAVTLDWEYVSKSDGNYIKIHNMPGLLPSKKYAVTLMAFAG